MPDMLADRIRTIVAVAAKLPPHRVQFTATLTEDLGVDGLGRIAIGCDIESALDLPFDTVTDAIEESWSTVADVVTTAERLARGETVPTHPAGAAASAQQGGYRQ